MDNLHKRFLLFLIGCIGLRTLFVYIAKTIKPKHLPIVGIIALIPAIGFSYIYITDSRKTGGEVFDQKIWWGDLRPLHAFLYFTFAYMAITKYPRAWTVLFLDVALGLTAFIIYHYDNGDFAKIL
jgi:hypothetical protein